MKKITIEAYHYQITLLVFIFCMLTIITFLTGYFWGKKSALEEFAEQIKNESFSDKVYASLCSLYDQQANEPEEKNGTKPEEVKKESSESEPREAQEFVAHLIGYGNEKQARAYVASLHKRGIAAQVVARTSRSTRGAQKVWYQVVTSPSDYQTVQNLVQRLSLEDRLAGVSIVQI